MTTQGRPVLILAKIKNHIKTLPNQASIGWVIPPKSGLGTCCLIRNGLKAYNLSEGAKRQTFEEAGQALLEHDKYVRSLLLNTVTQWLNALPAFITNEIPIQFGSASGNDATISQEPDRHASPASPGSDIPQEWVSNLKDQRPRSSTAKPKSDLWQSYNFGLPPVGQ